MSHAHLKSVLRELAVRANMMGSVHHATIEKLVSEAAQQLATTRALTEVELVRQFQTKFGHLEFVREAGERPRWLSHEKLVEQHDRMKEELREFRDAVMNRDFAGVADALVDLDYFAKGTSNMLGLPWEALFLDVHRANMEKEPGAKMREGKLHKLDAVKPPGWQPPKTMTILLDHGYLGPAVEFDEEKGMVTL